MAIPTDPVIGVDVAASTISAGLVFSDGTVFASVQTPTQCGAPVLDTILALIDRVVALAEELRLHVAGIGVGLPGLATALDTTTVRIVPADKRGTVRGGAALVLYEMARRRQDV